MSLLQKIYFNNKPIVLLISKNEVHNYPEFEILEGANQQNFDYAIKVLSRNESKGIVIFDTQKEKIEKELSWAFYPLHSAGGVVKNENEEVLMIFRQRKWDLPKGKQDEGETIEQCAVREVCEETGLKNVVLKNKICTTMHLYPMNQKMILKHTAWYNMTASASEKLFAQAEENIEQVAWVKASEIPQLLQQSFETIHSVLHEAKIL